MPKARNPSTTTSATASSLPRLAGRVALVTGAARGLGRSYALALAASGASVVVNDLAENGDDATAAAEVVAAIGDLGGAVVASYGDVSNWDEAGRVFAEAVEAFGQVDVVVNNAGILRDRSLANMEESAWDAVVGVHLKGHAGIARAALGHWRDRVERGETTSPSLINTSSVAGLVGIYGQSNYASAKLGILALSRVVALEGARLGVRSNVVAPAARTRLTLESPGFKDIVAEPEEPSEFDRYDPENVAPLVVWLATADCPANGQVFHVLGDEIIVVKVPEIAHRLRHEGRWTLEGLDARLPSALVSPLEVADFGF